MAKQIIIIISVFIFSMAAFPQAPHTGNIKGTVQMADGTKLPGVTVSIVDTTISTITDKEGTYFLTGVKQGVVMVAASLEGFEEEKRTVVVQSGITIVVDFTLEMTNISHEAIVEAERPLLSTEETVSTITLTPRQIETLPSLGEKDVFRAFQLLPGILGSNETSSGLYIRGGTPDQNLISYDGFTIYHVDHLFGYFSAFNMEAVSKVRLNKGGYEAKYGGRLSSIMELTGNPGSGDGIHGSGGFSLLSLNGLVEASLFGKGSFILAGRRSFQSPLYDNILGMFTENTSTQARWRGGGGGRGWFAGSFEAEPRSYFYDINSKLTFKPGSQDTLFFSFYNGLDTMDNSREQAFPSFFADRMADLDISVSGSTDIQDIRKWGNTGVSANWIRKWHQSFQSHILVAYSNYLNQRDMSRGSNLIWTSEDPDWEPPPFFQNRGFSRGALEDNNLDDLTFRWDNTLRLHKANTVEFGVQVTKNKVTYDYDVEEIQEEEDSEQQTGPGNFLNILSRDSSGIQYSAYLQDRWTLFDRFTLTPGIRVNHFDTTGDNFFEPRLSFNLILTNKIRLKGAWGRYSQIINRITREDVQEGNREFWALSDGETIPFGKATHYILGMSYENQMFLFDIEAFHKDLSGLSEFALRFTPWSRELNYNQFFYSGTGVANGLEFLLQKKSGLYTGWISYTLSKVEHTFPDLEAEPFPALHDQTHEFKLVNSYDWNSWTFSGTWICATGRPYTEPVGVEEEDIFEGRRIIERVMLGPKNGARLPAYHRLDLSVSYRFRLAGSQSIFGATVFNLYDRKNVWYKEFDVVEGEIFESNILYMGQTFNLFITLRF
jgi:ferric enterobactin receptor